MAGGPRDSSDDILVGGGDIKALVRQLVRLNDELTESKQDRSILHNELGHILKRLDTIEKKLELPIDHLCKQEDSIRRHEVVLASITGTQQETVSMLHKAIRYSAVRETRVKSLEDQHKEDKANKFKVWLSIFGLIFSMLVTAGSAVWFLSGVDSRLVTIATTFDRRGVTLRELDVFVRNTVHDKVKDNALSIAEHTKHLTMLDSTSEKLLDQAWTERPTKGRNR